MPAHRTRRPPRQNDTRDPHPLPNRASDSLLLAHAVEQVVSLVNSPVFGADSCARCLAGLEVGKFVAMAAPELGPALAVALCHRFAFNSDCDTQFGIVGLGAVVTQVIANADVGGFDGQVRTAAVGTVPRRWLMIRCRLCRCSARTSSGFARAHPCRRSTLLAGSRSQSPALCQRGRSPAARG